MTVTTTAEKDQYTLTGAGTEFAFSFKIFAETDLVVIREDTAGVETTLTLTTDYTVSASPWESGGTVTTVTNYADGTLTIKRQLPRTQTKGYTDASEFPAATHEEALDRAVILIQELEEQIKRAALLKETTTTTDITFPEPSAGKVVGWNSGATDLENKGAVDVTLTTVSSFIETLLDDSDRDTAISTLQLTEVPYKDQINSFTKINSFDREVNARGFISREANATQRPALILDRLVSKWTGAVGETGPNCVAYDDEYIYCGLGLSPAKVLKIDRHDMVTVDSWTGATGENNAHDMIIDNGFLYVSCNETPAKVVKIDVSDMTTSATWTGTTGEDYAKFMTTDGSYIYTCLYVAPGKVAKIDISDMTTDSVWTGATNENYAQGVAFDGVYLYVGLDLQPFEIVKVGAGNMTTLTVPHADNPFFDSARNMYGASVTRSGQVLSLTSGDVITQVDLMLDKVGSPTGTGTVVIRQSSDDSIVGTLGTIDVSTLSTTPYWYRFKTDVTISNTENHRIMIEYSGGDASNYLRLRYDSGDRTNGDHIHYNGSYTTASGTDASIRVYPNHKFYGDDGPTPQTYGNHCLNKGVIYATTYDSPAAVIKINLANMIETASLTFNTGENKATVPVVIGDDLMVALDLSPGKIIYVKASDLTRLGSWTGDTGENRFYDIAFDGLFVYVPASFTTARVIRKIIEPIEEVAT